MHTSKARRCMLLSVWSVGACAVPTSSLAVQHGALLGAAANSGVTGGTIGCDDPRLTPCRRA